MNILIVSGFLGAGKTTFIRALSHHTGKEIAILENEYGGAGIDGEILRKDTDVGQLNIWEMTEGCICCSMKGDFAASVLTIANSVDPECLVIEPTGVGFLSNIIANLKQIEYDKIHILQPVTIVDGYSVARYTSEYTALYADQVSCAGKVFVSKMESADADEKERVRAALQKIAPNVTIVTDHYSGMSDAEWNEILETSFDGSSIRPAILPNAEDMPDTFTIKNAVMKTPENLILMLENLIRGAYGEVIRAKGVVKSGMSKYRFDVADSRYAITGATSDAENQVVFIGKDIKRQGLRRNFFEVLTRRRRAMLRKKTTPESTVE